MKDYYKVHAIFVGSSPVLLYFLFVNLSWEKLNHKASFASSLDIDTSSASYAEYYWMMSVLFLAVFLTTELAEQRGEQRGRPEA